MPVVEPNMQERFGAVPGEIKSHKPSPSFFLEFVVSRFLLLWFCGSAPFGAGVVCRSGDRSRNRSVILPHLHSSISVLSQQDLDSLSPVPLFPFSRLYCFTFEFNVFFLAVAHYITQTPRDCTLTFPVRSKVPVLLKSPREHVLEQQ